MLLISRSAVSDALQPHGLQHARLPCPSLSPEFAQTHVANIWRSLNSTTTAIYNRHEETLWRAFFHAWRVQVWDHPGGNGWSCDCSLTTCFFTYFFCQVGLLPFLSSCLIATKIWKKGLKGLKQQTSFSSARVDRSFIRKTLPRHECRPTLKESVSPCLLAPLFLHFPSPSFCCALREIRFEPITNQ